jgi:hypothetical protein
VFIGVLIDRGGNSGGNPGVRDTKTRARLHPIYTSPVRILVNFMHRDGWSVHCLAEDAKTVISPILHIAEEGTLLRLMRASGATKVISTSDS